MFLIIFLSTSGTFSISMLFLKTLITAVQKCTSIMCANFCLAGEYCCAALRIYRNQRWFIEQSIHQTLKLITDIRDSPLYKHRPNVRGASSLRIALNTCKPGSPEITRGIYGKGRKTFQVVAGIKLLERDIDFNLQEPSFGIQLLCNVLKSLLREFYRSSLITQ